MPRAAAPVDVDQGTSNDSWIDRVGVALVTVKAVLVTLAMDPFAAATFGVPKSAVSRAFTYALLAMLLVHLWRRYPLPRTRLWATVALYLAVAGLATVLAVHAPTALYGAHRRYLGLTSILDGAVLAFAVATFTAHLRDFRWLVLGLFGAATAALAYGLVQLAGLDPIRWLEPARGSTIGNPAAFAGYLTVVAALATGYLFGGWPHLRGWERAALAAVGSAAVIEVLLSGARGPALALPIVLFAAIVVGMGARALTRPVLSPRAALIAVAAGLLAFAAFAVSPAGSRVARLFAGGDGSVTERGLIYKTSLDAILARPLLGAGPDGFATVYLALRPSESNQLATVVTPMQSSTHSWVLHQAVGTGLVGLSAFLGVTLGGIRVGWSRLRRRGSPAAAMGLLGLVAFLAQGAFNIDDVAIEWLYWLSLGLIASRAATSTRTEDPPAPRPIRRIGDALPALLALLVGAGLATTVTSSVRADQLVHASNIARGNGDLGRAEALAETAVQYDGGRADHWNVLGLARSPRSPESAVRAFEKAAQAAPYDSTYLVNVAKEAFRVLDRDPAFRRLALEHSARAVRVDPQNPETHLVYGFVLLQAGQPAKAAEEADKGIALRSVQLGPAIQLHFLASDSYKAMGRPDVAADRLRSALALADERGHVMAGVIRLDLARLLHQIGQDADVRSLISPPRLIAADRSCAPTYGFTEIPLIGKVPRCVKVTFAVGEFLESDPSRADAVTRPDNFLLDGVPLPPGTDVSLVLPRPEETVPIAAAVEIQFRPDVAVPGPGAILTVRRVADRLGNVIRPDPASAPVR